MKYHCGNGKVVDIDRKAARLLDLREKRHRLHSDEVEAIIALNAARNMLDTHNMAIKKHALYTKSWGMLRCSMGMLRKALEQMAAKVQVEQIVALQHNTQNAYVNVTSHVQKEKVLVDQQDLFKLTECARGALHDEHMQYHKCNDCIACMDREAWQNCELYHLLLHMPCYVTEEPRLSESTCPYALLGDKGGFDL